MWRIYSIEFHFRASIIPLNPPDSRILPLRIENVAAELAERICGFANALGGMLIIGVADKTWEVVGVKSFSGTSDALLQAARLCKPTVQFDPPQPQVVEIDEKELVLAHVPPNDGTLY